MNLTGYTTTELKEENEMKKIDLTGYTTTEFAKLIGENDYMIQDLLKDSKSCSYVNNPYEAVVAKVKKSKVADENREIVAKYLHANLFNNSPYRFCNGRGYGVK